VRRGAGKISFLIFALLLWVSTGFPQSSAQNSPSPAGEVSPLIKIRFSASNSWSAPFAFYDHDKNLIGGILKETMDAIAAQLGREPLYLTLPRKVVDQASEQNKIDMRCYVVEGWVKDPNLYNWSEEIFDVVNVIAFAHGTPPVRRIEDLKGVKVGTVLGYKYPKLEAQFTDGTMFRSNACSESSNIQKLVQNRVSYAIVENLEFAWQVKGKDRQKFESKDFFELERFPIKCALLKTSSVSAADFNRAIGKLKREGFFKKLLSKYEP
jgi:polar amino acid transport system substrate-binding protein